jgi:hypothetical protein
MSFWDGENMGFNLGMAGEQWVGGGAVINYTYST